jgi:hypothetical protein
VEAVKAVHVHGFIISFLRNENLYIGLVK